MIYIQPYINKKRSIKKYLQYKVYDLFLFAACSRRRGQDVYLDVRAPGGLDPQSASTRWARPQPLLPH